LQGPAVGRSFRDHNPWPQMSHKKLVGLYRDSFMIWSPLIPKSYWIFIGFGWIMMDLGSITPCMTV
jgi:hypothetical protein